MFSVLCIALNILYYVCLSIYSTVYSYLPVCLACMIFFFYAYIFLLFVCLIILFTRPFTSLSSLSSCPSSSLLSSPYLLILLHSFCLFVSLCLFLLAHLVRLPLRLVCLSIARLFSLSKGSMMGHVFALSAYTNMTGITPFAPLYIHTYIRTYMHT